MAKKKTDVILFRFKFTDDAKTRAAVISVADRMFRKIGGILERRSYSEEEVADVMKRAILQAEADTASSGNPVRTLRERTLQAVETQSARFASGHKKNNKTERTKQTMNAEIITTLIDVAACAIPIGSYVLGLGYMIWKGL